MKLKSIILTSLSVMLLTSCVSNKTYLELDAKYKKASKQLSDCQNIGKEKEEENNSLKTELSSLKSDHKAIKESLNLALEQNNSLNGYNAELKSQVENANKRLQEVIASKGQDLQRINDELFATQEDLSKRAAELDEKEQKFRQLQSEFKETEELLSKLQQALSEKEQEVAQIQEKISSALLGFADKGLSVETKNGKVYVSMEEKLLFSSGSWDINSEGAAALKEIAKVLANNPDINVMVEGHTDNVPLKGKNQIKDNWDLSVMRATSVTKILLENKQVSAERIIPCGRSEYLPLIDNKTAESKAKNRRTEIILTPKVDELMKIINK
jgi:chemotaxis protein MotB